MYFDGENLQWLAHHFYTKALEVAQHGEFNFTLKMANYGIPIRLMHLIFGILKKNTEKNVDFFLLSTILMT